MVSYTGIPEAIDLIMPLGKGALLAKFDIRHAYRLLPVKSQQRHMLGMQWQGKFYIDLALPFGLRSSPKIFTRFADALQFLLEKEVCVSNIKHYLDDFFLVGSPNSNICQRHLEACFSLCETLGVPIAQDKTEGPATCITYLGFKLDSVKKKLQLAPENLTKVRAKFSS